MLTAELDRKKTLPGTSGKANRLWSFKSRDTKLVRSEPNALSMYMVYFMLISNLISDLISDFGIASM